MSRVLLVTGARSLATRPGAEAWGRVLIAEAPRGTEHTAALAERAGLTVRREVWG